MPHSGRAGPALNIILAVLCLSLWWLIPASYYFTENFAYANMSIAAVNLLPVYPLDGGRITLAAASRRINRQTAYKRLRIAGYAVSAVFAGLFVASCFYGANLSFASMSAFILRLRLYLTTDALISGVSAVCARRKDDEGA